MLNGQRDFLIRANYLLRREYILPRVVYSTPRKDFSATKLSQSKKAGKFTKPNVQVDKSKHVAKKKLALLLPGHNEELIIQATIKSALAAGMKLEDIYVVDDNSSDKTRSKATALLSRKQVLTVERSGKALAVIKAIKHFDIQNRYTWVHIADADSVFGKDYFRIYRKALNGKKYVVALGFVQSLRGNWLSTYRSYSYTYAQHIIRRWQSWFGMISVFPGPITSFRTDIIDQLDFNVGSIAEDLDLTVQVHRKKLGKVRFIPEAVNYTQDPQTLRDYCKQTLRWQRGFFQAVTRYRIGTKAQMLDLSVGYTLVQFLFYILGMFVLLPITIERTGHWMLLPILLTADFVIASVLAIFSSIATKRIAIMGILPYYYFLRWLETGIFIVAFVDIVILRKFQNQKSIWDTENRRYALDSNALQDTA